MEQLTIERLHDNLARLKLTRAAEVLNTIVDTANQQKISYLGFSITSLKRRWQPRKAEEYRRL